MQNAKEVKKEVNRSLGALVNSGLVSRKEHAELQERADKLNFNCVLARDIKTCSINMYTSTGCSGCGHRRD